jgi:hypothetical protein
VDAVIVIAKSVLDVARVVGTIRVPNVPQCSVALEHGKLLIYKGKLTFLYSLFQCSNIYINLRRSLK